MAEESRRPIKVLLADDHTMFRQGLARVLASYEGMEVVAQVPNDSEAIRLVREYGPDVVVMQVQLPLGRARETLARMREVSPRPKVIIVTMFESPRYIRALMEVGASAYLVKTASTEHLVGAVRAAVFDPQSRDVVVGMPRELIERARANRDGVLSAREMELLVLAARGLSNREIAAYLHISESTVKRHLANIYPKLGVASRGEVVRKALEEELITIQDITGEEEQA